MDKAKNKEPFRQIHCWSIIVAFLLSTFVRPCWVYLWVFFFSSATDLCVCVATTNMNIVVNLTTGRSAEDAGEIESRAGSSEKKLNEDVDERTHANAVLLEIYLYADGKSLQIIHINRSLRVKVSPIIYTPSSTHIKCSSSANGIHIFRRPHSLSSRPSLYVCWAIRPWREKKT